MFPHNTLVMNSTIEPKVSLNSFHKDTSCRRLNYSHSHPMDQMHDSIADQQQRLPRSPCYMGCASEDEKPQRKPKSINQSGWFSCSRLRSKKFPKRTVPVDSATDDQKVNIHEKGISTAPRSKKLSFSDELPAKCDDENQTQPPDAGQVLFGKAKKTRSGKGNILLGNSKSMNHIQSLKYSTSKHGLSSSLIRKCTSAKATTINISLINQPAAGSHLVVGLSAAAAAVADNSQPVSSVQPAALTDRGVKINKTDEKNKGISIIIIVMVLLVWGKLCAFLFGYTFFLFLELRKVKMLAKQKTPNPLSCIQRSSSFRDFYKEITTLFSVSFILCTFYKLLLVFLHTN